MQGNPYIMGLITQAGVIVTAILSFITALVQLHSNKKAKDSDKTLLAFKNDVNIKLQENDNNNKAMEKSMMILLRSQIVSKCENYQSMGYLPDYARSCLNDLSGMNCRAFCKASCSDTTFANVIAGMRMVASNKPNLFITRFASLTLLEPRKKKCVIGFADSG